MNQFASTLIAEAWAMEPRYLEQFARELASLPADGELVEARMRMPAAPAVDAPETVDGVAHIALRGPVLKRASFVLDYFGVAYTATDRVAEQLAAAAGDDAVKSIVLDVDSPGGTVSGVADLAADIRLARKVKPVAAHIEDIGASAAYWLAAQADTITAGSTAAVGSVGVCTVVVDSSRAAEDAGVRVHVVASHPLKGAGVEGAAVTDAQLADIRRNVEAYARLFADDVAAGRRMSADKVASIATGQVWIGAEAQALGLVDAIVTPDEAHRRAAGSVPAGVVAQTTAPSVGAQERETMSEKGTENTAGAIDVARMAKIEAENAALKASVAAITAQRREDVIERNRDRVPPTALEAIRKMGETYGEDLVGFEAAVKTFPVVTRSERASSAPVETAPAAAPAANAGEQQVAKWLRTSTDNVASMDGVSGIRADGSVEMKDGRVLTRDAFRKLAGLVVMVFALAIGSTANAAATAARQTKSKNLGGIKAYVVKASETIYAGTLVAIDGNGFAISAAASASNHGVVGVAVKTVAAAASGTYWVEAQDGWFLFAGDTLQQDDVGKLVYAQDNQTVDETAGANEPIAGVLIEYVSASSGWVLVGPAFAVRDAVSADPLTLTDDLTCSGGAGALTFTDSASSVVLPDNDTTALLIGSTGKTNLLTFDTGDGTETVIVNGTAGQQAFSVATGTASFSAGVNFADALTLSDGLTIDQSANNVLSIAENSEDVEMTFSSNKVALSSTTGVATFDFGSVYPIVSGTTAIWALVAGANTACDTTCTHACVFGQDTATYALVACNSALADVCMCAGPN